MQAGEMLWDGNTEAVSVWLDKKCPKEYWIDPSSSFVKNPNSRDGIGFSIKQIQKAAPQIAFFSAWKISMETNIFATEAADRASAAIANLDAIAKSFRSNTKNDIVSMKAASERVQSEVERMSEKYTRAMELLNSSEFLSAVEHAERMAKALESISELSETKLSFAVFSGSKV